MSRFFGPIFLNREVRIFVSVLSSNIGVKVIKAKNNEAWKFDTQGKKLELLHFALLVFSPNNFKETRNLFNKSPLNL